MKRCSAESLAPPTPGTGAITAKHTLVTTIAAPSMAIVHDREAHCLEDEELNT